MSIENTDLFVLQRGDTLYHVSAEALVNSIRGEIESYVREEFLATAGQTVFQLSNGNVFDRDKEYVYLNGSLLNSKNDYIVANAISDAITLNLPALAGDVVEIIGTKANYLGSITNFYTRETFTATAGQDQFTLSTDLDFSNDREHVYLNGSLLSSSDYTTNSDDNSITLSQPALADDVLEIITTNYSS